MILAANFKTNHTRESTDKYLETLNLFLKSNPTSCDIRVYPGLTSLLKSNTANTVKIGAQNFYPALNGAYTGEIGAQQLDEFGIRDVLIGHSERRLILGETQEFITKKFNFAKERGWRIIYCIGEPKVVRDGGFNAVMEYLWDEFDGIDVNYQNLSVAYEPIWAIGTGVSAKTQDIAEVLDEIKKRFENIELLYGGSVNAENLTSVIELQSCRGALIGNAGLEADNFCKLIQIAQKIKK